MALLSAALVDLRQGLDLSPVPSQVHSLAELDRLSRLSLADLGGLDAYRALLPELFAAAATPAAVSALGLEWARLSAGLDAAGIESWPIAHNEAIARFLTQVWMALCTGELPAWQAHDALFAVTRRAPAQAAPLLAELSHRPAAPVRRALLAELSLKGDRLGAPWVQQRAEGIWIHPAEATVRIWLCDPWRGVELAQEHAGYRGPDGSAFRRRLERWRQMVKA